MCWVPNYWINMSLSFPVSKPSPIPAVLQVTLGLKLSSSVLYDWNHMRRVVGSWRSTLCWHGKETCLPSLVCHPVPLFPCTESQWAASFPCLNAHCCLPEDREETIKGFIANGVERKKVNVIKIGSYQLQRHLRRQYLGPAMPLQLSTRVRTGLSPW